jgi:hypothetical protein
MFQRGIQRQGFSMRSVSKLFLLSEKRLFSNAAKASLMQLDGSLRFGSVHADVKESPANHEQRREGQGCQHKRQCNRI